MKVLAEGKAHFDSISADESLNLLNELASGIDVRFPREIVLRIRVLLKFGNQFFHFIKNLTTF